MHNLIEFQQIARSGTCFEASAFVFLFDVYMLKLHMQKNQFPLWFLMTLDFLVIKAIESTH